MKDKKIDELLDSILNQVDDKDSLMDLQDKLFKRGVETLLKSELKAGHLIINDLKQAQITEEKRQLKVIPS